MKYIPHLNHFMIQPNIYVHETLAMSSLMTGTGFIQGAIMYQHLKYAFPRKVVSK